MLSIKIVLGASFEGMNSGWPVRYIGLIRELSKKYHLFVFAPGNQDFLSTYFPDAAVRTSGLEIPQYPQFTLFKYFWSFIHPRRDVLFIPEYAYFINFNKLLKNDSQSYDLTLYFGLNAISGYGDSEKSYASLCDICDSTLRHLDNAKNNCTGIKQKIINYLDCAYTKMIKRRFIPTATEIIAISQKDAEYISKALPHNKIHVVPNGTKVPELTIDQAFFQKKFNSPFIVFLGSLNYEPNLTSLLYSIDAIWPILFKKYPQLRFRIIGRCPSLELKDKLASVLGIEMVGEVETIYPYLIDAKAFLSPMHSGGGMKNKFLEALSVGTPIVTNKEGATGIDLISGKHGKIAETTEEIVYALEDILNAPFERYSNYISDCLALAKKYTWEATGQKLITVIENIIDD